MGVGYFSLAISLGFLGGGMRLPGRCLCWLLGVQAQWCGVVAPGQLVMDTETAVALAAGECRAYRVAVTAVMAAADRGLLVQYRSRDVAGRPTDGYVAYGLAVEHSLSASGIDTSPTSLGVSEADGCWATAGDVTLGGEARGTVLDLALVPGTSDVGTLLPHDVPTNQPPEVCELPSGDYWVYVANKGAVPIDLQLRASIDLDSSFSCSQAADEAVVEENWWGVTLLIALGAVAGVFLLGMFLWYCVCTPATPYEDGSDLEEGDDRAAQAELQSAEQQRVRSLLALEAEGDALFSKGDVTAAAERYAAAAVLEPEGSERRQELEERLRLMLEREKEQAERVYTLEDKRRPDQYYEDGHHSGTDDEEQVLGAEAVSVEQAKTKAAQTLAAVSQSASPDLKTAAGRREEQEARDARLRSGGDGGGGGGAGGFNRTVGSPRP